MTEVIAVPSPVIDLDALKGRQRTAWSAGNYAVVGTTLQIVGENLCEALDLRAGARVLDVAAGNGNATLAAARRWCDVTSTDYVFSLLESGRARAEAEGHAIHFQEADAERLPFPDASFDVVMSTFGVMFTREFHRPAIQDNRQVRSARARRPLTGPVGHECEARGAVRKIFAAHSHDEPRVRLPLPLTCTLDRSVSYVLRPDEQDVRRPRCGETGGVHA